MSRIEYQLDKASLTGVTEDSTTKWDRGLGFEKDFNKLQMMKFIVIVWSLVLVCSFAFSQQPQWLGGKRSKVHKRC